MPDEFDEYVPPEFVPRTMNPSCRRVWQLLFGVNPDRSTRNYFLYRYLRLVNLSGFGHVVRYFDERVTDAAMLNLTRDWTQYAKITLNPEDGKTGVITIPPAYHGLSVLSKLVSVSADAIQTVDGVSPITDRTAIVPGTGIIIWIAPGATGNYTLTARLRPAAPAEIQPGLTADLAYVTAGHPFAEQLRGIVDKSPEWPLRQAAIVAALAMRIATDRGDVPA